MVIKANSEIRKISDYFPEISDEYIVNKDSVIYSKRLDRNIYPYDSKDGLRVSIMDKYMNQTSLLMHTIINTCFNGLPPKEFKCPVTKHIDGNKYNNDPNNLTWINKSGPNTFDRNHKVDYNDDDIIDMFKMRDEGKSNSEIAKKYNSTTEYIYKILCGQSRSDVSKKYGLKLNTIEKSEDIYQKRVDDAIKIAKCLINGLSSKDIVDKLGYKRKHVWKVKTKKRWQDELVYFDFDNRIDFTDINNTVDICNSEEITIGETKYKF